MIRGTAIEADVSKQTPATVPVTHYYDLDTVCRDCGRNFIFFAEEQKHWYEELNFPLEADCVRCPPCRKQLQLVTRKRKRYEALFQRDRRTLEEHFEMADCCLALIEEGVFHYGQMERVRMLLKRIPESNRVGESYQKLLSRLQEVERRIGATPRTKHHPNE